MRPIDADDFAERMLKQWDTADEEKKIEIVAVIANIVTPILVGTPTIDAEPVRHGRWIPIMHQDVFGKEFVSHHKCSVCEGDALCECANYDAEEELSNYCPNCGAKMDAEVQE